MFGLFHLTSGDGRMSHVQPASGLASSAMSVSLSSNCVIGVPSVATGEGSSSAFWHFASSSCSWASCSASFYAPGIESSADKPSRSCFESSPDWPDWVSSMSPSTEPAAGPDLTSSSSATDGSSLSNLNLTSLELVDGVLLSELLGRSSPYCTISVILNSLSLFCSRLKVILLLGLLISVLLSDRLFFSISRSSSLMFGIFWLATVFFSVNIWSTGQPWFSNITKMASARVNGFFPLIRSASGIWFRCGLSGVFGSVLAFPWKSLA